MSAKTVVIALLDKVWPPQHSFVDGMLAGVAAQQPDLQVRLCVSRASDRDLRPRRYRSAACIPGLYRRRRSGRLWNLWAAMRLIRYQAIRERERGNRVVLFVRNDPIYLLAASLMRGYVDRLVFQSSFPHEEFSGHAVKRGIARLLYRIAGRRVDAVTGVSPEGVDRVRRLCPSAKVGAHIPLLADLPVTSQARVQSIDPVVVPIFVYIGTHRPDREIEMILAGIVRAVAQGVVARFRFVGATEADRNRLQQVQGVSELMERDIIRLERPVSRDEIPQILSDCDVGVSLIPPKPMYHESSPTKLAEYMGAGLAVLASRGIPMQERFVMESNGGLLVDWEIASIAEGIRRLCADPNAVATYRENAANFARRSLQYQSYLPQFRQLIGVA